MEQKLEAVRRVIIQRKVLWSALSHITCGPLHTVQNKQI